MLKQRIIFGAILALAVLYTIFFGNLMLFFGVVGLFSIIALYEISSMQIKTNYKWLYLVLLLVLSISVVCNTDVILLSYIASSLWIFALLSILFYPKCSKFWQNKWVTGLFSVLVISAFFAILLAYKLDPGFGNEALIYVIMICSITDIGAYFSGKIFGKRKMSPTISPNKTIEGLAGGVITATLAIMIFNYFSGSLSPVTIALGILLSGIAVLGDLFESMLKRIFDVKDSSNLIPGHGGVLDRIDSMMPVITCYYAISKLMH